VCKFASKVKHRMKKNADTDKFQFYGKQQLFV
jgi:hypothetical protein